MLTHDVNQELKISFCQARNDSDSIQPLICIHDKSEGQYYTRKIVI